MIVHKKKKPEELWPKECCGVCSFSHMDDKDLKCYALPPVFLVDEELFSIRGSTIEPTDVICFYFKPKSMA
jgi:hypothetical protein